MSDGLQTHCFDYPFLVYCLLYMLALRSGYWVYDQHLLALLSQTGHCLKELNVSCAVEVTDTLLQALPRLTPQLELLDICYCTSMSVRGKYGGVA